MKRSRKEWVKKEVDIVKRESTSESPRKIIQNILSIFLGACISAFGDSLFTIPRNIVSGGIASLSIISHQIPGRSAITKDVYVLIYTWGFFFLGLILIGLKYSLNTLVYTITYPLMVRLFTYRVNHCVIDGKHIFNLVERAADRNPSLTTPSGATINATDWLPLAYLVGAVFGGRLVGIGIGFAFIGGGSSGGTDVINVLANRYLHIRIGTSTFICDLLIITGGFFANGYQLIPTLVGLLSAFLCAFRIDKVFLGNRQYFMALVSSEKIDERNEFINQDLGRGTTLISCRGGYTKKETELLQVCFDKHDYSVIRQAIKQFDPNAFVSVIATKEILGYGFTRSTPKVNRKDIAISPDDARRLTVKAHRLKKKNRSE